MIATTTIAIDILEWPGLNQAFLVSFLASILMVVIVVLYGKRRPVGAAFSWGEAMIASVYVFWGFFLAFGIVPHQWIDHADKNLGWSRDKLLVGWGGFLKPESQGGWNPITLQYEAVRDTVVVLIHAFYFGVIIWLAIWWQNRGTKAPKELEVSTYGRPLVKRT